MAASAFSALCAPNRFQRHRAHGLAAFEHHELGKVAALGHVERPGDASAPGVARESLRAASTRPSRAWPSRLSSPAFHRMRPDAGNGAHQVMELLLDRAEVLVDVGVIELEVVEDQRARAVVDELGALVEERRVVFIGLDDEILSCPPKPRTDRKVSGHAADQESRDRGRRARGSTPACSRSWSCRACPRRRARARRAALRAPAIRAPRCRECRCRAAPR